MKKLLAATLLTCLMCMAFVLAHAEIQYNKPDTLTLGQALEVEVSGLEDAWQIEDKHIELLNSDGSVVFREYLYEWYITDGVYAKTFEEYACDRPGTYRIAITGYRWNDEGEYVPVRFEHEFTATGSRLPAPVVTKLTEGQLLKNTPIRFRAEGTDGEDVLYMFESYADAEQSLNPSKYYAYQQGDAYVFDKWFNRAGTVTVQFAYIKNNVCSARTAPITLEIESLGQLPAPSVALAKTSFQAGEEIRLSFADTYIQSTSYNANLLSLDGDGGYNYVNHDLRAPYGGGTGEYEFLPSGLDSGSYELQIRRTGNSYDDSETSTLSFAVTGTRPAAPAVAPPDDPQQNERAFFRVSADGMEAAKRIYSYSDHGTVYLAADGAASVPVDIKSTVEEYRFRALVNGRWSEAAAITVEAAEHQGEHDGEERILEASVPETIQLGDSLPFTVELIDGAAYYTYSVSLATGEDWWERYQTLYELVFEPDAQGRGVIPPQYFMRAGKYWIGFNAYMSDGSVYYSDLELSTQVAEASGRPAAPTAVLVTENPVYGGTVLFDVAVNGAEKLIALIKNMNDDSGLPMNPEILDLDGSSSYRFALDTDQPSFWISNSADYAYYFAVCRGGVWSDYSAAIPFTLRIDGYLNEPELLSPGNQDVYAAGDQVTFSWSPVDDAEQYLLEAGYQDQSTGETDELISAELPASQTSYVWQVPSDAEAGGIWFSVYAFAQGYTPSKAGSDFLVADPSMQPSARLESSVIQDGAKARLTITAGSGEWLEVRINGKSYAQLHRDSETQTVEFVLPAGIYQLSVRAGDGDIVWSTWSDPVTLTVEAPVEVLKLPGNTRTIEAEAFAGIGAKRVEINSGCTAIGDRAFAGCRQLETVVIPASVREIAADAFSGCGALTVVTPAGSAAESYALSQPGWTVVHP